MPSKKSAKTGTPASKVAAKADTEKTAVVASASETRATRKIDKRRLKDAFRLRRAKVSQPRPDGIRKLPAAWRLFVQAIKIPARHWEIFGGIVAIYAVINALLIGGLSQSSDLQTLKEGFNEAFSGQFAKLFTGLALFGTLVEEGAGTASAGVASAYQTMLLVVISLAIIWSLRQVYAAHAIRVRDAFYQGMRPLVQYLAVLLVVGIQCLPAAAGGILFATLVGGGILQQPIEIIAMAAVLLALLAVSVFMLCSSLFAPYIVTLPDMTPMAALRSAKDIVRYRRASVLLKLLFLPLALLIVAAVIMVPVSLLLTPVAPVVFFVLTILGLLVSHSYMYAVYRELIAD